MRTLASLVLMLPALLLAAQPLPSPVAPGPWSPADSVRAAARDLATLAPERRLYTRYLDLGGVPLAERPVLIQVLAGHCNHLSSEPDMGVLVLVAGTAGAVLRLDTEDYGRAFGLAWEKLESPYQQVVIERDVGIAWRGGTWSDGKWYAAGAFRVRTGRKTRVRALAPWLSEGPGGKAALAYLVYHTQSQVPIVAGPWWLWQTSISEGRGQSGYYQFLGIVDQKSFEKLIRFNSKLAAGLEQRRVVIFSGVAQQPRRLERTNTVLGGLQRTFDNALALDKANPLRVLDDPFEFTATEQFSPLSNGLPAWYLGNNKGVRQDIAPPNVVIGDRGSGRTSELHVGISCIRCHYGGKSSGIMDVDGVPFKSLSAVDFRKFRELKRQYLRAILPLYKADQAGYAAAVLAASGLTIKKYGQEVSRLYGQYDEMRAGLGDAARAFGRTEAQVRLVFQAQERAGRLDPVLSILLSGGTIGPHQFEEVQPLIYQALAGYGR